VQTLDDLMKASVRGRAAAVKGRHESGDRQLLEAAQGPAAPERHGDRRQPKGGAATSRRRSASRRARTANAPPPARRAKKTGHPREGTTALRSYKISKGPELSNPLNPNSDPTGNTIFVLAQVYESPAGVDEHWRQAIEPWQDLSAFMEWSGKGNVSTLHSGTVVRGLW
jgi:hypothetical protein